MSQSSVQATAQIIQFPAGGRKALAESRRPAPMPEALQAVVTGEAWYHEAAIQDARRNGER